jgi:tripartite-type tricarboxylate transporter receptor subunit TctC
MRLVKTHQSLKVIKVKFKIFFLIFALFAVKASAEAEFPTKPITIVVPYPAGGVSDALARALAQRLTIALKQQVLIDNRAGGNTLIGAQYVAKAAPDGYTLMLTAEATLAMNPHLYSKLPYDVEKNFSPIVAIAQVPQSLAVANDLPVNTVAKFIAYAKTNPQKTTYATLGVGSTAHLNFELFQKTTGVKLTDVAYKGAAPALTDLMGGHVNSMIVSTGFIAPQAISGKVRVLAVSGKKRSLLLPEVPTFAEAGVSNFSPSSWFALLAVAGTPKEIIKRFNFEIEKTLNDPVFRKDFLNKYGLDSLGGSPDELASLIKSETLSWGAVIRDANIKLD